jgi:HK97 family phage prohead protease
MNVDKVLELSFPFIIDKDSGESDDKSITITGYANTTTKDRQGDVIVAEAWTKGGLTNYSKNPIVLAYHKHDRPIGFSKSLAVDAGGLKVVAEISATAKDVYQLIKEGILKAFSVGFRVKDADYDSATDIFVIKDVELYEVSVVSVPANQDSLFEVSKCFNNPAEYAEFKKSFSKVTESTTTKPANKKEKFTMDKEVLDQLKVEIGEMAAKAAQDAVTAAETKKAEAAAKADSDAKAQEALIKMGQTGAERLVKEVQDKITDDVEDIRKTIGNLQNAIKEQSEAFATALNANKRSPINLGDKGDGKEPTLQEKTTAVLVAKTLGREIKDTKYGSQLVEKYGPHVASAFWEDQISLSMQDEIRKQLVVAPLFTNMVMPSSILRMPVNPEAGYSTWVLTTSFGTASSSGAAATHALKEITLTAYKLATKEFLTYEEEDDSLIALMPIVQNAMVRRSAKSIDKAFLRGAASGVDPLKGLTVWATAGDQITVTNTAKVTVANLQNMRREVGDWGLNPKDVVYIVESSVYFDLLEDTAFATWDKVGPSATVLNGSIGMANGSQVIVSGEFAARAGAAIGAVCVNPQNFIRGNYKDLRLENAVDVEKQQKLLVATQRLAFQQLTSVNGNAVGSLLWS